MKRFLVIGNPVQQSLSPKLHNELYRQLEIDAEYDKLEIKERKLPSLIKQLRAGEIHGINVTIPFKEKIIPLLDEITPRAKNIGAVNCVSLENGKAVGYNSDSVGFLNVLDHREVPIAGQSFVVLGAGGAARSIVYVLLKSMADQVIIINRNEKRAHELIEEMTPFSVATNLSVENFDGVNIELPITWINCTSIGMDDLEEQSPVPIDYLKNNHCVMDLVYHPLRTKFICEADQMNAKIITGLDLLIEQGLESFKIWFRRDVSAEIQRSELISALLLG